MARVNVFFLHGFLGLPQDWAKTMKAIRNPWLPWSEWNWIGLRAVDYFNQSDIGPENHYGAWANNFNEHVKSFGGEKNYIVGYSLGGRLALHAMRADYTVWEKGILISTNPGFPDGRSMEKETRRYKDHLLAENFRADDWDSLMEAWNSQSVFDHPGSGPKRLEKDYSRELLRTALLHWTVAEQGDQRAWILENAKKIKWIVGADDTKYVEITESLKQAQPEMDIEIIEGAGHRVLFDQPKKLGLQIKKAITL